MSKNREEFLTITGIPDIDLSVCLYCGTTVHIFKLHMISLRKLITTEAK